MLCKVIFPNKFNYKEGMLSALWSSFGLKSKNSNVKYPSVVVKIIYIGIILRVLVLQER